jgi:hypothetical protein
MKVRIVTLFLLFFTLQNARANIFLLIKGVCDLTAALAKISFDSSKEKRDESIKENRTVKNGNIEKKADQEEVQ